MKIPDSLKRYGLAKVYDYLDKDPMNNMGKVMDLVNKFAGDTLSLQREAFDKVINDKDSCWHQLIEKVWTQTDPKCAQDDIQQLLCQCKPGGLAQAGASIHLMEPLYSSLIPFLNIRYVIHNFLYTV